MMPTFFIRPRGSATMWLSAAAAAVLAVLAALTALTAPDAGAQPSPPRTPKQIRIMEKVIDQVLVDSRNALVTGAPNCRGVRLEGYGVLFVVELSPIMTGEDVLHFRFKDDGSYEVIYGDDEDGEDEGRKRIEGRVRARGRRDAGAPEAEAESESDEEPDIVFEDEAEDGATEAETPEAPEAPKVPEAPQAPQSPVTPRPSKPSKAPRAVPDGFKKWAERWEKRGAEEADRPEREAALRRVRDELVEALRDYGHTITGLRPDEYLAIAIFPSDLDWRDPGTRTLLQVRQRAVGAFNDGQITAEAFAKEVEILTQ